MTPISEGQAKRIAEDAAERVAAGIRHDSGEHRIVTEETGVSLKIVVLIVAGALGFGGTSWAVRSLSGEVEKHTEAIEQLKLQAAKNEEAHKSIAESLERIERAVVPSRK